MKISGFRQSFNTLLRTYRGRLVRFRDSPGQVSALRAAQQSQHRIAEAALPKFCPCHCFKHCFYAIRSGLRPVVRRHEWHMVLPSKREPISKSKRPQFKEQLNYTKLRRRKARGGGYFTVLVPCTRPIESR